jgi:hypothetical protein
MRRRCSHAPTEATEEGSRRRRQTRSISARKSAATVDGRARSARARFFGSSIARVNRCAWDASGQRLRPISCSSASAFKRRLRIVHGERGGAQVPTYRATTTPPSVLCLRNEVPTRMGLASGAATDASAPEILPNHRISAAVRLVFAAREEGRRHLLENDSLHRQSTDQHPAHDHAHRLDLAALDCRRSFRLKTSFNLPSPSSRESGGSCLVTHRNPAARRAAAGGDHERSLPLPTRMADSARFKPSPQRRCCDSIRALSLLLRRSPRCPAAKIPIRHRAAASWRSRWRSATFARSQ